MPAGAWGDGDRRVSAAATRHFMLVHSWHDDGSTESATRERLQVAEGLATRRISALRGRGRSGHLSRPLRPGRTVVIDQWAVVVVEEEVLMGERDQPQPRPLAELGLVVDRPARPRRRGQV